jgi:hypothetical protein
VLPIDTADAVRRIRSDRQNHNAWPNNCYSFLCAHCEVRQTCLAKLPENVNPQVDRHRNHRDNNNQDDEQWRYLCFSTPDNVKNNSICDSDDDGSDNKRSHKEVDHGFTPYASVLISDSKTVSDSLVA